MVDSKQCRSSSGILAYVTPFVVYLTRHMPAPRVVFEFADHWGHGERANGARQPLAEVFMRCHAQRAMKVALCHTLCVQKTTFWSAEASRLDARVSPLSDQGPSLSLKGR